MLRWLITPCDISGLNIGRVDCCECLGPRALKILKVVLKLGAVGYEICHLLV